MHFIDNYKLVMDIKIDVTDYKSVILTTLYFNWSYKKHLKFTVHLIF